MIRKAFNWLFDFDGTIDRRTFVLAGGVAFVLKIGCDQLIAAAFHLSWTLQNYVSPFSVNVAWSDPQNEPYRFYGTLLALSIPFACFGVALVTRRLRTCGLSLWFALLFFIQFGNIALFVALIIYPERQSQRTDPPSAPSMLARLPSDRLRSALVAVAITAPLGFGILALGSQVLQEYGWGLFVATPFMQGALAAYLFGFRTRRTLKQSIGVGLLSVLIGGACLLLFAMEGVVCIAMALPLAAAFAALGAAFGHHLNRAGPQGRAALPTIVMLMAAAPAVMGVSLLSNREASTFEVTTSVIVNAPVSRVWNRVVSFPQLAPPTELPFRLGVAYPIRAHISGHGVGAVRYCEFSTGPFVEPITVWDTNRHLAFRVASNPEPMQEWTPFAKVHPPHLDGYMQSLHGEFVLDALPGNRTRLTGTTWYRHHLWPEQYWRLWSDGIIHDIHRRVLDHIAALAEHD